MARLDRAIHTGTVAAVCVMVMKLPVRIYVQKPWQAASASWPLAWMAQSSRAMTEIGWGFASIDG
jgi:hypothetical protein